jgi:hypothetical protein
MISLWQENIRWRRRAPCVIAEILGRPDKPGDDEQEMMIGLSA